MSASIISQIADAAQALQNGDKAAARDKLTTLWDDLDASARPDLACVVAHYLADAMDEVENELAWDLRALEAANAASAAGLTTLDGVGPIAGFYPSLHLNLGDVFLRVGDLDACQRHLEDARSRLSTLPDSAPYTLLVRQGVENLALRFERARSEQDGGDG